MISSSAASHSCFLTWKTDEVFFLKISRTKCLHRFLPVPAKTRSTLGNRRLRKLALKAEAVAKVQLQEGSNLSLRVPFELHDGQCRYFHTLPSGMKMEVIMQEPKTKNNSSKKPPLVFVHGSYHAAWCWAVYWLPFFSAAGYHCYALSLLGQGESDIPSGSVAGSLQTHARDIAHFIKHNLSYPPALIGHSVGGLIVQYYLANMSTFSEVSTTEDEGWKEPYPAVAASIFLCSVPPTGTRNDVWRFFLSKPFAAFKVTLSLAARAFANNLSLCRETFFSSEMSDLQVERYQLLLKQSSVIPLFDLRRLNASLPVSKLQTDGPPILVVGAASDFIVSGLSVKETAEFYNVHPVTLAGAAHDVMLDVSWEKGANTVLSWLDHMSV